MKTKSILFLLLLIGFSAWGKTKRVVKMQQLEALSNSTVFSAYQDGLGAMWLGTNYGLYRYNGASLEYMEYVKEPLPMHPICGNRQSYVYTTAYDAIYKLDIKNYATETIRHPDIDFPNSAMCAQGDTLWISSHDKIYKYVDGIVSLYISLPKEKTKISAMIINHLDELLVATVKHGLYKVDRNQVVTPVMSYKSDISALLEDSSNNIWIGTIEGAYRIEAMTGFITHFSTTNSPYGRLTNNVVRTLCEDAEKNIWIGTLGGVNIFENNYLHAQIHNGKLNESSVWCLTPDNQGGIWIGTFYNGLYYCNSDNFPFTTISLPKDRDIKLINAMVEDRRGDVWILTDKFGMFRMEKNKNSKIHYVPKSDSYKFKSAYYDSQRDIIWVGTYMDGLKHYDIQRDKWTNFPFINDEGAPFYEGINDIKEWGGHLYLGTSHGVIKFDPQQKSVLRKKVSDYEGMVFSLALDQKERLWIGGIGVYIHELNSGQTYPYRSRYKDKQHDTHLNFIKLFNDSKDRIWAASLGQGFFLLDDQHEKIYNKDNIGLMNNFTSFVGEVKQDILLVGTNSGISIFDIKNNRCYNYNRDNGLGIVSARSGTLLHKSDGEILIGGMDGIESIIASQLSFQYDSIDVVFDKLEVNNKSIKPQTSNSILTKSLPFVNKIVLEHNETNIAIEVASFDYSKAYPIFYEYKLEGLDAEWTPFQIGKPIAFSNLKPDTYKLKVRSTLNKSSNEYKNIEIPIEIKSAWYATTIAKFVYICAILLVIFWLLYFAYSKIIMKKMLSQKEKEHLARIRFFLNISHEIRTPLTLIIGQLELFLKKHKSDNKTDENILSTYNNALRMKQLVSNLLDFEKQNQGYVRLSIQKADLVVFANEVYSSFVQYAKHRNINFSISVPQEPIAITMDEKAMQQVFSNLLINAFKYTPDGGSIEIGISKMDDENVKIIFSDTGRGISASALPQIFAPFFQDPQGVSIDRHNHGTGIGLALSKGIVELHHGSIAASSGEGKGAVFTIILPLGDAWYLNDDKIELGKREEIAEGKELDIANPILSDHSHASIEHEDFLSNGDRVKMLIVEDDSDLRMMLTSIFSNSYNVFQAENGEEAFSIAKEEQPDIIISDVLMPVMNGLSLCMKLKQDFSTCHIPIILLTAQSGSLQTLDGIKMGADDYITKPFSIEYLETRCLNMLRNRRLVQVKYSQSEMIDGDIATNDKDKKFLENIIQIIDTNVGQPNLNVTLLCQELGVGKTLLSAKVKAITSYTPGEFIEIILLKKAVVMLRAQEMNISEIAYSLGFSSPKYFTIRFKKFFNKTPTDFLQGLNN